MNSTNLTNSDKTRNKKTSSLSVSLKPRKVNKGVSLYLRLGYNGKETFISIGETVKPSEIKNGKVKARPELNALINSYIANIHDAKVSVLRRGEPINIDVLKHAYKGDFIDGKPTVTLPLNHKSKIPLLFDAMDIYVQSKYFDAGTQMEDVTKVKAWRYFNHLKQWASGYFGRKEIELTEIKPIHDNEIVKFMISVRGAGNDHATMHVQRFKSFFDYAIGQDWIVKNPFMSYKRKLESKEIIALDKEELTALENLVLAEGSTSDLVRDLFVFSCYTGLTYGDLKEVSFDNIKASKDGDKYLSSQRIKNDKPFTVPLLDNKPLELIEKYRLDESQNKIFKVPTNQFINTTLKSLATMARIKVKLTTYVARKTCGTLLITRGVDMAIVQRILGHSSINTTIKYYAKVSEQSVINAVKKNLKNN